ncbi:MAG: ATP-binding protein [Candidatus Paceibacterota bacterium]
MDIYIIISFINGLVAIIFGFLIFSKNWKNKINYTFFLMSASFALWSFSYSRWLSVNTALEALFWSRMLNFGATFIPIFYLHWILSILGTTKEKKRILFFGYALTLIFSLFSFTPAYISSVAPVRDFPYWPQAGFLYVIFLVIGYFGLVGYGLKELIKAKKNSDIEKTHQINYVFLGSILGFGGGATNFPLMFGIGLIPPVGQLFVVLFVIIFALATLKYHLFEIKLILTELLVFIMSIIIIVLFFLMPTTFLKILIGIIIILFCFFGYYLIRAIHDEVSQKEEAERISKMKTEFISIASHQLRTPLAAIRGYTSMLKDGDYGDLPDPAEKAINYIHESSVGMIKLVNSLLSISRLEKGQVELKFQDVSVDDLLKECIKDIRLVAEEKKLNLKYKILSKKIPLIKADPEKLKQSFSNIINNAVLYTVKGGVDVSLNKENNDIIVQIKDTGVGIEPEEQEKMFKSFSRGKGGAELYTQGTGLGLYVAKNFVEMHSGSISVFSEGKNKGSLFTIRLPIQAILDSRHKFNFTDK